MDYEKKYNEALERAKDYFKANQRIGELEESDMLSDIFPELKESESDKMIQYFKDLAPFDNAEELYEKYGFSHKDAIAWLEKQGEKMSNPRYSILAKLIEADDIYQMSVNASMVKEAKNKAIDALSKLEISKLLGLEKQGEQKPYGKREECYDCQMNYGGTCKGSCAMKRGEQKPWSEEDEKILSDIVKDLVHPWNEYIPDRIEDEIKWLKNRLKSPRPQPKQEWSEEIEAAITLLKDIAEEQEKDYCPHNANDLRKAAQYLETCRPQNTWKPSNEQIEALEHFVRSITESGFASPYDSNTKLVYSLFNDLKKLKL